MTSPRLAYRPVSPADLDDFHRLVQDEHVRRYLMDGQVFPREWSAARIADSMGLFARRGVGIWLVHHQASGELVGFCGFLEIPSLDPEPQLVYALFERFTGMGYATEMGGASIAEARRQPGFETIVAGVDEVNVVSRRVLDKLGFHLVATVPGPLGPTELLRLESPRTHADSIAAERCAMTLSPQISLSFDGRCEAAFRFYEQCLNGTISFMLTWGEAPMASDGPPGWEKKICHATLTVGQTVIMGSDAPPARYAQPRGFELVLPMRDPAAAERVFGALSERGQIVMALQETFWATRFGVVVDEFGITWSINCEKGAEPAS
jgi:PhnB protein